MSWSLSVHGKGKRMAKRVAGGAERLNQLVARELGTAILTGRYLPGESLEGEIEQSAALGVSRTAYREAMRMLVAKGLIESRPKAGTRVTERAKWSLLDPDVIAWMFSVEPDPALVRELFELRAIIEPAAAAMAAMRRTDAQVVAMSQCLAEMQEMGLSQPEGQDADQNFHRHILEATDNGMILSLAGSIGAAVSWTTRFKQRAHLNPRDPLPDHQAVLTAIIVQDGIAARDAMRKLLQLAFADMSFGE